MANTTTVRLDKVRTAIDALLDGGAIQSYTISGRDLTHYSLDELMRLEKLLMKQLNAENTGSTTNYIRFESPK
ncbi:MAG: hypothetical protein ABGY10_10425 [bacterium]|jgi:hypothetical protein